MLAVFAVSLYPRSVKKDTGFRINTGRRSATSPVKDEYKRIQG